MASSAGRQDESDPVLLPERGKISHCVPQENGVLCASTE